MRRGLSTAALLFALGCSPTSEVPPGAVARFGSEFVTEAELDRAIGELSAGERRELGQDPEVIRGRVARDIVYRRLLLDRAVSQGTATDEELSKQRRQLRREVFARAYLEQTLEVAPVAEELISDFYRANPRNFDLPARREIHQIFLRRLPEESDGALMARLEEIRLQVTDAGSFADLARQHSDSETRHDGGRIGWIDSGQVAAELSDVLFALQTGVPSQPFLTREGGNLFLVSQVAEAVSIDLESARPQIRQMLQSRKRSQAVDELVADVEPPEGSYLPTPADLQTLLASSDPELLVFRLGDLEITLGELRRQMMRQNASDAAVFLDAIRRRELCFRLATAEGFELPAAREEELRRVEQEALVETQRRKELLAFAEEDEQRLEDYYASNSARFATPLRLDLDVLVVPTGEKPDKVMREFEAAREAIAAGDLGLEDLRERLAGRVTEHDGLTVDRLGMLAPRAAGLILTLREGEVSYPFRIPQGVCMVRVRGRDEPRERSFEEARRQVRESYVASHGHELDGTLRTRLLAESGFELLDQG